MDSMLVQGVTLCVLAFVLSALLARAAIAYAHRHGMLDEPGFRRSHHVPTPRGGGIGLVVGSLLAMVLALTPAYSAWVVALSGVAGLAVAVVGWIDDHRGLPALPRLLTQLVATALFAAAVIHVQHMVWWWLPVWVLLGTWSINLHNFMDGIDAILGLQVLFVAGGLGVLAWYGMQPYLAMAAFSLAAAACGFLVFNWPPARIFMGDVGSGFAGFMIFALIALVSVRVRLALWPALLLCSAFVADAGLTLAWRMWRGKRWYSAHREHIYQWLARSGWTHAQTGALYMLWNVALAAPLAVWASLRPATGPWLCAGLYAVATGVWWWARRACITNVRQKGVGHAA